MSTLLRDAEQFKYHSQLRIQVCDDEFDRFLNTETTQIYQSKEVNISNDIQCRLDLYPKGVTRKHESYVQCLLVIPQLLSSTNINNITLRFKLCCYQTNSKYEDIKVFTRKSNGIGWASKTLKLSKCEEYIYDQLDFICDIEIIQIRYNNKHYIINGDYYKSLETHKTVVVSWKIDNILFNKIKSESFDKSFYSEQIANCYRVCISPNYSYNTTMMDCNLNLYLILNLLPPRIQSMTVLCKFECPSINIKYTNIHRFSYKSRICGWPLLYLLNHNNNHEPLQFIFTIKILKIKDINNKIIPSDEWITYGIQNELLFGQTTKKKQINKTNLDCYFNRNTQRRRSSVSSNECQNVVALKNTIMTLERQMSGLQTDEMIKYLSGIVLNIRKQMMEREISGYSDEKEEESSSSSELTRSTQPSWYSHIDSSDDRNLLGLTPQNSNTPSIGGGNIIQSDTVKYENTICIAEVDDC